VIFGIHTDIFVLVAMLAIYMSWAVWRSSRTPRRTPVQDEFIEQGKQSRELQARNTELLARSSEFQARQTVALERIASALEKLKP
jgi:hypothetical protein